MARSILCNVRHHGVHRAAIQSHRTGRAIVGGGMMYRSGQRDFFFYLQYSVHTSCSCWLHPIQAREGFVYSTVRPTLEWWPRSFARMLYSWYTTGTTVHPDWG